MAWIGLSDHFTGAFSRKIGSLLQRHIHDRFDGVHAVFRFIKHDGLLRLKHIVRDFHRGEAELLMNLLTDRCVQVMERGQSVHEDSSRLRERHDMRIYLVRTELFYTLFPDLLGLSH